MYVPYRVPCTHTNLIAPSFTRRSITQQSTSTESEIMFIQNRKCRPAVQVVVVWLYVNTSYPVCNVPVTLVLFASPNLFVPLLRCYDSEWLLSVSSHHHINTIIAMIIPTTPNTRWRIDLPLKFGRGKFCIFLSEI